MDDIDDYEYNIETRYKSALFADVMLQWQKEPPTQEGQYWAMRGNNIKIVQVKKHRDELLTDDDAEFGINSIKDGTYGHWLGPLPVPELPKG
jgi:hypothetical protein